MWRKRRFGRQTTHMTMVAVCYIILHIFFFLSFTLLIVWHISTWTVANHSLHCSITVSCCFCLLALSTAIRVFLRFFPKHCSCKDVYCKLSCLIIWPIHEMRLFFKILIVIFLLSCFEMFHHMLFYLPISCLTFLNSSMFQKHLRPSLHVTIRSVLIHKQRHSK